MDWRLLLGSLRLGAFGALVLLGSVPAAGQVTLRQGSNDDLEIKEFHSPVTAEVELADFAKIAFTRTWSAPSFGKFYCDDVAIAEMELTKSFDPIEKIVTLKIWTRLKVRMQEDDKSVALEFSIHDGDRRIFLGRVDDIGVQAGDHKSFTESYELPRAEYDAVIANGKAPALKVMMSVRTN